MNIAPTGDNVGISTGLFHFQIRRGLGGMPVARAKPSDTCTCNGSRCRCRCGGAFACHWHTPNFCGVWADAASYARCVGPDPAPRLQAEATLEKPWGVC